MKKPHLNLNFSVKITLSVALLALAGIGLFAWLSYRQHAGHLGEIVREELAATARNAAPLFTAPLARFGADPAELTRMLETLDRRNERAEQFRLFVIEGGEPVLRASSTVPDATDILDRDQPQSPQSAALLECMQTKRTCVTPVYSDEHGRWVSAFAPVTAEDDRLIGVLAADRRAVELDRLREDEVKKTILYSLAALAASIGLGVFLSRRVTMPLKRLYKATAAAREGRFEPVEASGEDEIAVLTRDFNETHETLLEKVTELAALAGELEERVEQRTEELRESYEEARRARDLLQREINVARHVQETIVPKGFRSDRIAVDVEYLPIMDLGGDWGIVSHRRQGFLDIAIGDVTGHGLGAALVVNRAHTLLSQMCSAQSDLDQLVRQLDFFLAEELADIGIYMTFAACRLDLEAGKMRWIGAGHPPLLVYRAGEITRIESTCGLLGVGELFCDEPMVREFDLESGDILLLHTDGLSDAFNSEDEIFGLDRLEETILKNASSGCDGGKIASCITREVKDFTGGYLQDDVLLILATIL